MDVNGGANSNRQSYFGMSSNGLETTAGGYPRNAMVGSILNESGVSGPLGNSGTSTPSEGKSNNSRGGGGSNSKGGGGEGGSMGIGIGVKGNIATTRPQFSNTGGDVKSGGGGADDGGCGVSEQKSGSGRGGNGEVNRKNEMLHYSTALVLLLLIVIRR